MNHIGALLMILLLLALATPALVANPAAVSGPQSSQPAATALAGDSIVNPLAHQGNNTPNPQRPVSKERSRRPARIDLTMPYYRFGRLPIRVKD